MSKVNDVVAEIKSILNSSKEQVTISSLGRDYELLIGTRIPFKEVGFQTLEDLLRDIPNLRLNQVGRDVYLDLRPDAKIAHITKLVQEQRSATKKKKKRFSSRFPPPRKSFHPSGRSNSAFSYNSRGFNSSSNYNTRNFNNSGDSNRQSHGGYRDRGRDFDKAAAADDSNRYRGSQRTDLDFSDNEIDYEPTGFTDEESSDETEPCSYPARTPEQAPAKQFEHLSVTVGNSTLGAGRGDRISRVSSSLCQRLHESNAKKNVDNVPPKSTLNGSKKVIDLTKSPSPSPSNSSLRSHVSPGSILATARAAKNELTKDDGTPLSKTSSTRPIAPRPLYSSRMPFSMMQTSPYDAPGPSNSPVRHPMVSRPARTLGMFQVGPDTPPSYAPGTVCQKLFAFAVDHGLTLPEFSNFHKIMPRTQAVSYMSRVKVGEKTFPSTPFEHHDLSVVQEYVANNALEELRKRYEDENSNILGTTTEKQQIIQRITEIVSSHPTGLKSETVEEEFKERFKEKLPADWLEIIKTISLLSVEKLVGGIFVYPPDDTLVGTVRNVNKLPPMILPEYNEWPILTTMCLSTASVYFRLVTEDHIDKYCELTEIMASIYGENIDKLQPVDVIKDGNYYVARLQGEWHRVKVLSANNLEDVCRVSLVDHGDTDEVLKECIFHLDEKLTHLPAQAIKCSLTLLDQLHDNEYVTHTLSSLIQSRDNPTFMARVDSRNPNLKLTLFDTTTEEDINVNESLKLKLDRELTPPKIPSRSSLVEVYLTQVREDGGAHIQVVSDGLTRLMSSMIEVREKMLKNEQKYLIKSVTNLVGEKMVLAKYHGDGMWYRAVVKSLLNGDEAAHVHFIDFGNTEIVALKHLAEIKHFALVLTAIPPQAVAVQISRPTGELFTQSVIEFLMSLALATDDETASRLFLMKVVNSAPVPDVEFFLRDDENQIIPLNSIIGMYYPEYRGANFQETEIHLTSSLNTKQEKKNITDDVSKTFPAIPPCPVPDPGEQFPVYVSDIVSPSHFVVQPLDYRSELIKMEEEMKKYYSGKAIQVSIDQIALGNVFAFESDRKIWCRGQVHGILKSTSSVTLKCLDYMELVTMDFTKIFPLMPCFRKLPALAIKAEMAGITPIYKDWNMIDCLRFHELLAGKVFTSVIVDKSDEIVSLMLFDTSVQPERDIGAFLVEEGRAIDVTQQ